MVFDILGWLGTITIILAYFLLSINKIKNDICYQTLNLIGGLLMAIGLFPKSAWFSFTLEIIWAIIAFLTILKIQKKKSQKNLSNN